MASTDRPTLAAMALPPFVAAYIRLVHRTVRWQRVGQEHHARLIASGEPFICAFWHSRLLMVAVLREEQGRPFRMMISDHSDGEVIARTVRLFGATAARGSAADPRKPHKAKGGAAALKALVQGARDGVNTGVTPDGPRGPAQRAQAGVAQLARLTGLPVLPISYSVSNARFLPSWDRFLLPLPFGQGVFTFGDPVRVDGRGENALEAGRRRIESELNRITALADGMMGHARDVHGTRGALA